MTVIKRIPSSAIVLLCSNLIALGSALFFHWSALDIYLSYWLQSFFIGVFQRRKIIDIFNHKRDKFGVEWVVVSGSRVFRKDGDAGFSIIYGTFWAGVGVTLYFSVRDVENLVISPLDILFQSAIFYAAHWWSYRSNKKIDQQRDLDPMVNCGLPLLRMFLPLALAYYVIDFGTSYSPAIVVLWISLKTVVDVGSHLFEHDQNRVIPG